MATATVETMTVFDPVEYSLAECAFLAEHLGDDPDVVLDGPLPHGVMRVAVEPILREVDRRESLRTRRGHEWVGVERLKAAAQTYLDVRKEWDALKLRGAPKFPTRFTWDGMGRPHLGGVGSDSGKIVTYFDKNGERKRLAVSLSGENPVTFKAPWVDTKPIPTALKVDDEIGRIECTVCPHTETFKPDTPSTKNLAMARMRKHLISVKDEVDRHRGLSTNVFGS